MDEYATPTFAELLKDHRLAAGLTQEALAERAGVSVRSIQNLERGENMPLKDTAQRLVAAIGLGERERALFLSTVRPVPRRRGTSPLSAPARADDGEAPLGTGMLAVLVSDLRGYTAFTHAQGDTAGAALALRFTALAGTAITAAEGRVVEVRGDEVLAVFTSARAALRAAAAVLARCAEEASEALPLRAGVGLDVGEPIAVPGGYRGEVVNTAARLCALAGPGEVLASEALVALARRVEGLAYQDRGALALKGLARPVHAWLVRAGDAAALPDAFPDPPDSPPVQRRLLPEPTSSFIGREPELERVLHLLAHNRLVTLTGPGGVGKTRLALQVAHLLPVESADEVIFVPLGAIGEAGLVGPAIAEALSIPESGGEPILSALTARLKAQRVLLILDNFEQVIGAAPLVAALLSACPDLKIVGTSRVALHISGEQGYAVPPMALPTDDDAASDLARVAESPAVELFVERARLVKPDFALAEDTAPTVAAICRRLDGLPLAIELAAARVRHLSVHALLGRLDHRLSILTGGPRDQPARQQTLRNTIAWSHDLLDAADQRLFRRLAVFVGGWTLVAAEAVGGADVDKGEALDALTSLLDNNLLLLEPGESMADRYRMLETIHEFALERLEESGGTAALRERHATYYLALAEETADTAATQLAREHDNLRAALRWAKVNQRIDLSLGLSAALWRLWHARGFPWEEGGSTG